jgi:YVTN family beta-propeller protein
MNLSAHPVVAFWDVLRNGRELCPDARDRGTARAPTAGRPRKHARRLKTLEVGATGHDHRIELLRTWPAARCRTRCALVAVVAAVVAAATAGVAQAAPFVYVANEGGGSVSQFDAAGGALAPLSPPTAPAGLGPLGLAVSPDASSLYVANESSNSVSQYDIGADGALSPKTPATVAGGSVPFAVAVSPDGTSVYVANINANTLSQCDVDADGTLTPKSSATVATGGSPAGVAVSPDGASAYVANNSADTVSQYDVGVDGTLSPKTPRPSPRAPVPWPSRSPPTARARTWATSTAARCPSTTSRRTGR